MALLFPLISFLFPLCLAQSWYTAKAPGFIVQTASSADQRLLPQVFDVLQQARKDLLAQGLSLPETVKVVIYPSLESYTRSTGLPWFIMAAANRQKSTVHTQRLKILTRRGGIRQTLRHELFHLAQPSGWPRWKAEGMALHFSGEKPKALPLEVSEQRLEQILTNPPDQETLNRAMATAYKWTTK